MPFFPPDNPALRHKQLKVTGKNDSLARSGESFLLVSLQRRRVQHPQDRDCHFGTEDAKGNVS
ncbi:MULTISPECIES: hypothetical protein [Citrobacter]|uniref:Uncharacterized protein n=1 Tax=Citrobacter portucalensis TaxID=1639133 RepID=A0AAW9EYI4_9ENTR|nr:MULTISPECIES: hypothetical protein [Citrobacter]MBJ9343092.1 hypothetical protein [Citrobacter freundii]KAA1145826.1 hypothetical protein D3H39_15690 [Citrobacter portucalensis]MCS1422692.1 hypothetical protein [Citrobacter portucalensis]MCX9023090.1 hypothetical protein [Citrobacter portucalensis]MDE9710850.1 hypothetical protein [Citrobacter portucalensis]